MFLCVIAVTLNVVAAEDRVDEHDWLKRPGGRELVLVGDSGTQCVMQNVNIDYRAWIDGCAGSGGLDPGRGAKT
jgi:hypothetical protein